MVAKQMASPEKSIHPFRSCDAGVILGHLFCNYIEKGTIVQTDVWSPDL